VSGVLTIHFRMAADPRGAEDAKIMLSFYGDLSTRMQ
jgi:hypothetical protein